MALISTVEPIEHYYVQLLCFGAVSVLGFVAGIAYLCKVNFAKKVLIVLSWVGFLYFAGSGILGGGYALFLSGVDHTAIDTVMVVGIMLLISLQGIPFYLMARKLKGMSFKNA